MSPNFGRDDVHSGVVEFVLYSRMNPDWFTLPVAALYALVGWHFWRTRWQGVGVPGRWEPFAMLVPLVLHLTILHAAVSTPTGLDLGIGNAISLIVALTVLVYWLTTFHSRMEALQAPLAVLAGVAVVMPLLLPVERILGNTDYPAFRLHLLIALLSYSLFTIAALHALMMSVVEKRLHHLGNTSLAGGLPPLLTMEMVLFRVLGLGFVLLTLTLVSGVFFSEEIFHKPAELNHKTVFAVLAWLIYAMLLGGRWRWGWRGQVAVRWTWSGFVMLVLAYVGTHFVLEVILHRPDVG